MNKKAGADRRRFLILQAIGTEFVYGLDIMERFNQSCQMDERISKGSLYVTLNRMEQETLILGEFGESVHPDGGNRRKYYRLTRKGVQVLGKGKIEDRNNNEFVNKSENSECMQT